MRNNGGLMGTSAANASLLNNFEIAATSLIALFIFKEFPGVVFIAALLIMALGTYFASTGEG